MELFNVNAEEALIGSIIIESDRLSEILTLTPSDFYISKNRLIWKAILSLAKDGIGIDNITIADWMENEGSLEEAGGPGYIARLLTASNGFNTIEHAKIIKENSRKREALSLAGRVAKLAGSKRINDLDLDIVIDDLRKLKEPDKRPEENYGGPLLSCSMRSSRNPNGRSLG
jgi:replicative DNA helicase